MRPDDTNPSRKVERYEESARERFLSAKKLATMCPTTLSLICAASDFQTFDSVESSNDGQ